MHAMFRSRLYQSTRLLFRYASRPQARSPRSWLGDQRSYVYRAINHQRLLASWNAFRLWTQNPMFRYQIAGIGLFGTTFYLYHLERAPLSERLRFNMVSSHWERQLGQTWFQREMEKKRDIMLPQASEEHARAQRVLYRLTAHHHVPDEIWEVHVIDDSEIGACSMPGGKVFVNQGMLDLCKRDDELAVVLGHEIAHDIVRHSSERLSRWLVLIPVVLIGYVASGLQEDLVQLAIDVAFKLPHGRAHEVEADRLGLTLMAENGYDPAAALDLWARWDLYEGDYVPPFLRTHPSHHDRLVQFYLWQLDVCRKQLSSDLTPEEFHEAYCLQRTFCGVERHFDPPPPPKIASGTSISKQARVAFATPGVSSQLVLAAT